MKFTCLPNRAFRFSFFLLTAVVTIVGSSCKKNSSDYDTKSDARDSAYIITQDIYLWPEKLPSISVFKPRDLASIYDVMNKVKNYQPLDKWSFAETKEETALSQKGDAKDFGFMIKFASPSDLRVIYVYANSSAGISGIKRTWRLIKINNEPISYTESGLKNLNNVFFSSDVSSASFVFAKPDGTEVILNLQKTTYPLNTVLFSKVYTPADKPDKKVGYFVFNEFGNQTSRDELATVFNDFQAQGVNEMIIDLRYNRGGFVETQDMLANRLAPTSVGTNQKIMYTLQYNKNYRSEDFSEYFKKSGSLNLNRVFFIVSPSSASASELIINNLKGIDGFNVILIGDTRTYGKPVGFFPIPVFEYNIFPVSFKTVNSKGQADYYSGFPVDKNVQDDFLRDFGDENEANLKQALHFITSNGSFLAISTDRISSVSTADIQRTKEINAQIAEHLPSATIEDRPSRMPESIRRLQR